MILGEVLTTDRVQAHILQTRYFHLTKLRLPFSSVSYPALLPLHQGQSLIASPSSCVQTPLPANQVPLKRLSAVQRGSLKQPPPHPPEVTQVSNTHPEVGMGLPVQIIMHRTRWYFIQAVVVEIFVEVEEEGWAEALVSTVLSIPHMVCLEWGREKRWKDVRGPLAHE